MKLFGLDDDLFWGIARGVQQEKQMGGLLGGPFYDFARECTARYLAAKSGGVVAAHVDRPDARMPAQEPPNDWASDEVPALGLLAKARNVLDYKESISLAGLGLASEPPDDARDDLLHLLAEFWALIFTTHGASPGKAPILWQHFSHPTPNDLTHGEKVAMGYLGLAWNVFQALPAQHKADKDEFMRAIHAAQNIIYTRLALRMLGIRWEDA